MSPDLPTAVFEPGWPLRRGVYDFLRQVAAQAWTTEINGMRFEITVPPELEALPEPERYHTHARQEAQRVAAAQLFEVCPRLTRRAVQLGEELRKDQHERAVELAGKPNVVATLGIHAPAESGFLRWQGSAGIASNSMGAPIIACHWGPAPGGWWLAWWADTPAMAKAYAAEIGLAAQVRRKVHLGILTMFGPLWYDCQQLIRPLDPSALAGGHSRVGPAAAAGKDEPAGIELIYTTLATWRLFTTLTTGVQLTERPLPKIEEKADRVAGLRTGLITFASAAEAR